MDAKQPNMQLRTKKFSLGIVRLFKLLPKNAEAQILGKQLLRGGTSVGANTRSAFRGRSAKEFKAKIGIVIEEADESMFWLEVPGESETFDHEMIKDLNTRS